MLLIYYSVLSGFYYFGLNDELNTTGYTNTIALNDTAIQASETDSGGFFSVGISFLRFVMFIGIGIGLGDVPTWFAVVYALWTTIVNILAIGWFINSIWSG
jgi:hypothetical protein